MRIARWILPAFLLAPFSGCNDGGGPSVNTKNDESTVPAAANMPPVDPRLKEQVSGGRPRPAPTAATSTNSVGP